MRSHREYGFTLIELLVVVAIIAALIAILLPSMSKAKEYATQTVCASSLRQCAVAAVTYSTANKGQLPAHGINSADSSMFYNPGNDYDLREMMGPYVGGNMEVWSCPTIDKMQTPITDPANIRFACYGSYQFFPIDSDANPDFGRGRPVPRRMAQAPATFPLIQDRTADRRGQAQVLGFMANHVDNPRIRAATVDNPSSARIVADEREQIRGINIGFYDGSVHWTDESDLVPVGIDGGPYPVLSVLP